MLKNIRQSLKLSSSSSSSRKSSVETVASKEIAKAGKEGKTELDLSGKAIVELPEDIGSVKLLVWLNLSGNSLSTLPDDLVFLGALLWLDISNNQFSVLPTCVVHLSSITELNVQGNQLLSLPSDIGNLKTLEKLSASKNKLTSIPEEIGNLSALKELDVSSNDLVVLPQSLSRLSKLSVLGLGKNRISVLPHELGVLRRIRILDVRDNPLELPPLSVVAQGSQAILNFLRESMKGSRASAAHTVALGDGLAGGVVGKELSFVILAKDEQGVQLKMGGDLFLVELSSAVGGLSKELEITDLGNGSHEVKYIPEKHGEYILKVQIDGGHIVGSPFICRVTQFEGVSPPECYASGAGIKGGSVGDNNTFTIHAVSKSGNPISDLEKSIKITIIGAGNKDMPTQIRARGIGMYDVSYVAMFEGDYIIEVRINDTHIMNSPFYAFFEPHTKDSKDVGKPRELTMSASFQGHRPTSAIKLKRLSGGLELKDSSPLLSPIVADESEPSLNSKWSDLKQSAANEETNAMIDTLFSELLGSENGPTSIFDAANASNTDDNIQSKTAQISLAKGLVALVNESQKALQFNLDLQSQSQNEDIELQSGLMDNIQSLVEERETIINTAIFAHDLESRIRAFNASSEQLSHLRKNLDLDGYINGLVGLQNLSTEIFEAVKKGDTKALDPLLAKRNQARMDSAKNLNGMLKIMSTITEMRSQGNQDRFVSRFFSNSEFTPSDPAISMEAAIKQHDNWQTTLLTNLGPKMEKTNTIMLQLLQALKEEQEVIQKNRQLIEDGPKHLATIAYVKQREAKESTAFHKTEDQMLNFTCLQRHFLNAATQMAHTPTPEQLKKFTSQVDSIQGKQKDSEKQLLVLQTQYQKLQVTEKIGSRALSAIQNEIASVRRHQGALKESEKALLSKLDIFAQTQYPEILLQSAEFFKSKPTLTLAPKARLSVYTGTTLVSANTLLTTAPGGGKCLLKKYPVPTGEAKTRLEHTCSFLHSFNHPNLMKVHEIWEEDGFAFIELPQPLGLTLREWISKRLATAPIPLIRGLFEKTLSALATLHLCGIVHGALSLDAIVIQEELDTAISFDTSSPLVPVLCNFDFGLGSASPISQPEPWQAPELASSGQIGAHTDMWDFGNMLCEAFSVSQSMASLVQGKQVASVPQLVSRINTKHLQPLLQAFLRRDPKRRLLASAALVHPYFTSELTLLSQNIGDANPLGDHDRTAKISEFYVQLHTEKQKAKGVILLDAHAASLVDSIFGGIAAVQPAESAKPIRFFDSGHPEGVAEGDVVANFFEAILKNGMMQRVNESVLTGFSGGSTVSSKTLLYLPNPSYPEIQHFEALGRFLMKCLIDGRVIPPLFAPSLFKYLAGKKPTIDDLEAYDPNTALRLRFSLAEDHNVKEVGDKVEDILVKKIETQLAAIKKGFKEFDTLTLTTHLSEFDLMVLGLTPGFYDTITPESVRKTIAFSGFPEGSETIHHFHRYLDSLTPFALRMFLYFATSRCTLASGTSVFELLESMAINQDSTKILVHAVGAGSGKNSSLPVRRTFVFQIDLPDFNDFTVMSYALSSAIIQFCHTQQ